MLTGRLHHVLPVLTGRLHHVLTLHMPTGRLHHVLPLHVLTGRLHHVLPLHVLTGRLHHVLRRVVALVLVAGVKGVLLAEHFDFLFLLLSPGRSLLLPLRLFFCLSVLLPLKCLPGLVDAGLQALHLELLLHVFVEEVDESPAVPVGAEGQTGEEIGHVVHPDSYVQAAALHLGRHVVLAEQLAILVELRQANEHPAHVGRVLLNQAGSGVNSRELVRVFHHSTPH